MSTTRDEAAARFALLTELVGTHVDIAGEAAPIGRCRWGIYGSVALDGAVLLAEYDSAEEARQDLSRLAPNHGQTRNRLLS